MKKVEPIASIRDIDSFNYNETTGREIIFNSARARGCEVIIAKDSEVQIDLDVPWTLSRKESIDFFTVVSLLPRYESVCAYVSFSKAIAWKSRNGNTHVVLTLTKPDGFTDRERVILALCLGSDPIRELLNLKRLKEGSPSPIVLFKPESKG